jgi:hypothetical protein
LPLIILRTPLSKTINSLRTDADGDFCHQGRDIVIEITPKNVRLSEPADMTIHWKALGEHILMVQLVFRCNQFHPDNRLHVSFFFLSAVPFAKVENELII